MFKRSTKQILINQNPKVVGYTRASTDKQSTDQQKFAIYQYCQAQGIDTSNPNLFRFVEIVISSRKSIDERKVWSALSEICQVGCH